jgi:hypothetical protein
MHKGELGLGFSQFVSRAVDIESLILKCPNSHIRKDHAELLYSMQLAAESAARCRVGSWSNPLPSQEDVSGQTIDALALLFLFHVFTPYPAESQWCTSWNATGSCVNVEPFPFFLSCWNPSGVPAGMPVVSIEQFQTFFILHVLWTKRICCLDRDCKKRDRKRIEQFNQKKSKAAVQEAALLAQELGATKLEAKDLDKEAEHFF